MRALTVIPKNYREALILVAAGNLSYEDIAGICGIALGTVKSRIRLGLMKLRDRTVRELTVGSPQLAA